MTEAERERIKLTANFINIFGAGTAVTGGVAPLAAALFGRSAVGFGSALLGSVACITIGVLLHLIARGLLRKLDG